VTGHDGNHSGGGFRWKEMRRKWGVKVGAHHGHKGGAVKEGRANARPTARHAVRRGGNGRREVKDDADRWGPSIGGEGRREAGQAGADVGPSGGIGPSAGGRKERGRGRRIGLGRKGKRDGEKEKEREMAGLFFFIWMLHFSTCKWVPPYLSRMLLSVFTRLSFGISPRVSPPSHKQQRPLHELGWRVS
jgi:hypothetical protein